MKQLKPSAVQRAETAIALQRMQARGEIASRGPSAPYCTECRGEPELKRLLCGWQCPTCKRVSVDVVGSESGIAARWAQP